MLAQVEDKLKGFFPLKKRKALEDWDFIMVFEEYYRQEIQITLDRIQCKEELQWTIIEYHEEKQVLFLLKLSDQVVIDMAHELKILKQKNKKSFKMNLKELNEVIYTMGKGHTTNAYNYLCFIRSRMYPKNKKILDQQRFSAFNKNKIDQYITMENGELFTEEEKLRAKYHFLLTYSEKIEKTGDPTFKTITENSREPMAQLMKHPGFVELVPVQKVSQIRPLIFGSLKDYLGPNIDCYFQFVEFFQRWLWFPLIVGLLTAGVNYYFEYTVDNSPVDFIYAWAVMIWSILFITRWEQIHEWMKIKQCPGNSEVWSEHQEIVSRKGMEKHISPVTGKAEYYLSLKDMIMLQLASNGIFISITVITMVFMVLSLNLRGFIDPEHKLFYSQYLSNLAAPGGLFDANTFWAQIPNIFHVIVTNSFDEMVYRPLAKKLAKFEKHRSTKGYENSIIIKYFIYQFLITFADLFYIAFVRFDIDGLRDQLFSLFFIDIVRRVVAESVIPWAKKTMRSKSLTKNYENTELTYEEQLEKGAILEVDKQPYEQFDDYLEIITNFGYLVMISSCFPLAPLLILIAHQVEIFQDKYKIVHIFKRKLPQNYVGMGRWKNIIVFMCYVSIITNIMLFAFSSEQVSSVFPKMFEGGKDLIYGNTDFGTLFGGAATTLFQSMVDIATVDGAPINTGGWDDVINSSAENAGFNGMSGEQNSVKIDLPLEDLFGVQKEEKKQDIPIADLFGIPKKETEDQPPLLESPQNGESEEQSLNPHEQIDKISLEDIFGLKKKDSEPESDSSFNLQNFKAPNKDSEVTFIAVLFFIEHFFLILFIVMRDMLKKRKSEADIFLERKEYKRKIKKNLPKDVLALVSAGMLINKYFINESSKKGENLIAKILSTDKKGLAEKKVEEHGEDEEYEPKPISRNDKKDSELSGDSFLLAHDPSEDEKIEKEQIRNELLNAAMRKKHD